MENDTENTDEYNGTQSNQQTYKDERDELISAAREGARTFDKAILTFGSAVFGASVAFLKDVAPIPDPSTIIWLGISWICFLIALTISLLSFLFSQETCIARIYEYESRIKNPKFEAKFDIWGLLTKTANWSCVLFLFLGVISWTTFALKNLSIKGVQNAEQRVSTPESRRHHQSVYSTESTNPSPSDTTQPNIPANTAAKK